MEKWIWGVDPGKQGGICIINEDHSVVDVWKFSNKNELDLSELLKTLSQLTDTNRVKCYMETVGSRPGQGVASTFTFGRWYGYMRGLILSYGIRITDVQPQK